MEQGFFITGTDTDAGKTWATVSLMHYFKRQGKSVVGMKPVASGCLQYQGKLKNADALLIQANATVPIEYDVVNPYAYENPISPHIAGLDNPLLASVVIERFNALKNKAQIILVEGAGGWLSPLSYQMDVADLAKQLGLPVILVVGMQLGCINHARLSWQAIKFQQLPLAGWIAVCKDPHMRELERNIETIKNYLDGPLLGILPFMENADFNQLSTFLSV